MSKTILKPGIEHPQSLLNMSNLALTYRNQGRWYEAEKLLVHVMEARQTKLGAVHPDALLCKGNLALIYRNQGRWDEAEKLEVHVMEARKEKFGVDHPPTLLSMGNWHLHMYRNQGRLD